ncbi:O-antigen ligase family protein [Candidatus Collierbacteria bacterium]|nr:O-antigen ligase family protein [Candidatus Collierbacteria bacterium]
MSKLIESLFYALFFFIPLVLWPGTSEVFEFNKMLLVYVLTILISAAWVVKWINQKKITIRRTPLDLPILLFLASQILSTIFSIDTHTSLWGYYSRFHGGLMSTISYIVLYYAFVTNMSPHPIPPLTKGRESEGEVYKIKFVLISILSSATLVSLYGIAEHFGIDKSLWVQDVQNRVFSTLGQPNWLSAYLVALLPLPIFLAVKAKTKKLITVNCLLTTLFLLTIWFTKSQSGLGATAVVLAAMLVYFLVKKLQPITSNYQKLLMSLPLITLAIFLVASKWSFFQKISPLGPPNLDQLVVQDKKQRIGGSDSLIIRQVVWQGARELAKRNPLFGSGVETFGYSYFSVRPAIHNLLSEWEFLYNKAHNEYLNTLANTGFFGLATYLFLNLASLLLLWPEPLFFGYLGIMITNYFGFSVVPVALFFFLFPAIASVNSDTIEKHLSINFHINQWLSLPLLLLITIYLLLIPVNQWRADLAYNRGKQTLNQQLLKPSLDYLEQAVRISPDEPLFWAQLAEAQAMAASSIKSQVDKPGAVQLMNDLIIQADTNSTKAIAMNPYQGNYYKSRTKVELYLGTIDPKYNQEAIQTLTNLLELSPTDAKVAYNLGLLYQSTGKNDSAKKYFQKAINLKPDYDAARASLKTLTKN